MSILSLKPTVRFNEYTGEYELGNSELCVKLDSEIEDIIPELQQFILNLDLSQTKDNYHLKLKALKLLIDYLLIKIEERYC